ncbi:hypothetical protein ACIQVR_27100 [Streptomyces xanthochromogenes]|uniref:hypothetical protein n=1 Tax=Streptomyces xanthochromogenes TaxID=67384 RepID=UPI00381BA265
MTTPSNSIDHLDVQLAEVEAQSLRRHETKVTCKQGRAVLHRADELFSGSAAVFTVGSKSSSEPGA